MKIFYSPSYLGTNYFKLGNNSVALSAQVLETQGLLTQLALHAGIHVEIPPYPVRLADYHNAMMEYDVTYPDNMFHQSIAIDSISVAKALLGWRDSLRMAGWNCHVCISKRIDALSVIETNYQDEETGLHVLLKKVVESLGLMAEGNMPVPKAYKDMNIEVACPKDMLPDYLMPVFDGLERLEVNVEYGIVTTDDSPKTTEVIEFSEQYKAEAWMAKLEDDAYDVWINSDNKRLDNWLHMIGKPVAGSDMQQSNPQITQMFLLAIQLFQRPLNVNAFLEYLYLPECPLPWKLTTRLASTIVREGGFCNKRVLECINDYLDREFKEEGDDSDYFTYLPFDLRKEETAAVVVNESAEVDVKKFSEFMESIKTYASKRAEALYAKLPYDLRIEQLREVATLTEALLTMLRNHEGNIPFTTLQQWAQSLYESSDFCQYNPQIGSRFVINRPSNIVTKARKVIWCDFFGDVNSTLSTDFLSPLEIEGMQKVGIRLWKPESEKRFLNLMLEMPLHQTSEKLTLVVCKKKGATELPTHPIRLQLAKDVKTTNGDELFAELPSKDTPKVDNHREEDAIGIHFNSEKHSVSWREQESFSSLEQLLQNPFDYFMNYVLGFSDKGPTEIKLSLTNGQVAHETIEILFMADRGGMKLSDYVKSAYEDAFQQALARKGALLLLPEHHLDRDKLRHLLRRCTFQLAEIIEANNLTVESCEQEEVQDMGFEGGIMIKGYIDMVLKDEEGRDVIFDLKWTSKKDKHTKLIEQNRDAQLAIYRAMLQAHDNHPEAARTAFFVMPEGNIVSSDEFKNCHYKKINRKTNDDILEMLHKGYAERRKEISEGYIETSDLLPIEEIDYTQVEGVFPLETEGQKLPKKVENKYSDYKCFTL